MADRMSSLDHVAIRTTYGRMKVITMRIGTRAPKPAKSP